MAKKILDPSGDDTIVADGGKHSKKKGHKKGSGKKGHKKHGMPAGLAAFMAKKGGKGKRASKRTKKA